MLAYMLLKVICLLLSMKLLKYCTKMCLKLHRIRSLLRRMDHETVAYEDMQRNLHYAARVLEAVFIDESR